MSQISISDTFANLDSQCALIPFITAGDPNLNITKQALKILDREGADLIEIGIPYSDPLADGPIIQEASFRALKQGITLDQILLMISEVNQDINTPLVIFTYYNLIINQGCEQFLRKVKSAGCKGLLVPDLPFEETDILQAACQEYKIDLILLLSPNTSEERLNQIIKKSQGCIYLVSSNGVTGMKFDPKERIQYLIQKIKASTDIPIVIGFGISTREDIQTVQSWGVNGIVMGTAFVKELIKSATEPQLKSFTIYCKYIKESLVLSF
uniref:tryptophan synthase alpha subunit n=1 Tax=Chroothece richteriana TaxID=101928 RepID=UPI001FCDC99A|nr:tryptophan synthase alpha subunit [Chroothece richteriana]UNJ14223.1 tryptophan synthase alpha subunit [Chroothece richteriana]